MRIPLAMNSPCSHQQSRKSGKKRYGTCSKKGFGRLKNHLSGDTCREQAVLVSYFNLEYEPVQTTVETKAKRAAAPAVNFKPQALKTTEISVFSETGTFKTEIENPDWITLPVAAKQLKMFLKEKDSKICKCMAAKAP